jgi:tetratricopeptide (TPR) repeat protein
MSLLECALPLPFFRKKDEPTPGGGEQPAPGAPDPSDTNTVAAPEPAKARKFFDRALAVHDSTNYEYAMTLWLQGLRHDPTSVPGLEAFWKSATEYLSGDARGRSATKDQIEAVAGRTPVDKYLSALLQWGTRPFDWSGAGLSALEQAVKIGLKEPGQWIGKRVLGLAGQDPKAKKGSFVQLMNLLAEVGAFDQAVTAGEIACRLDPSDARLAGEVKNMSAQATMKKSGFEEGSTVEAGAFRRNVKDISAQRAVEEEERIVKTEEVQVRAIDRAKQDYESRPADVGAIQKYVRNLLERGTTDDEKTAYAVLKRAYADTQNYRFKAQAGDLNLRVARRKMESIKAAAAADPSNAERQQAAAKAERQFAEMEVKEYEERVANSPTDLQLRFELGRRLLAVGNDERAIEQLQQARGSPAILTQVLMGLGIAFARLGWLDEAEQSYRDAIASHPIATDELAAELRYGLMDVLQRRATDAREVAAAEEAFKLASGIAVQRIGYKDIRVRRQALQELVKSLKG